MTRPLLSVVLLTLNEEDHIEACLQALCVQLDLRFEVILIDAASDDATLTVVRKVLPRMPVSLRLVASDSRLPIGEARNIGVRMARAEAVAFLSADAEPDSGWTAAALRSLSSHDMVFGRQLHAPRMWTTGAAVRGLRYRFPAGPTDDPLRFASNVAAAYRKDILERFPFDPWANAAEDLLLARRAAAAGYRATYDPEMVVMHHDVGTARQEMRKNVREGWGCARYAGELGLARPWLAWGAALVAAAGLAAARPRWGLAAVAGVLWAPALRRAMHHRRSMPPRSLVQGIAASPAFDVAFLVQYVRGLADRRERPPVADVVP